MDNDLLTKKYAQAFLNTRSTPTLKQINNMKLSAKDIKERHEFIFLAELSCVPQNANWICCFYWPLDAI